MTAPIDLSRVAVRQAADLARLRRRRAAIAAAIILRDQRGDECGADQRMGAFLRATRAIHRLLEQLDEQGGAA